MGFGFFKKKESVPPDVGNEINDSEEYETDDSQYVDGVTDATKPDIEPDINQVAPKGSSFAKPSNITQGVSTSTDNLKLERLGARMESVDALLKGFSERFSMLSQQVGELRGMNLSNEKSIGKIATESSVAIDIVSELKPEKLRLEYQKMDIRVQEILERTESNKQLFDSMMNEIKDIKRRMSTFIGTDALLKLNEDVKKDLINLHEMASKVKVDADKSEQLFIELRKDFAESQKTAELMESVSKNNDAVNSEMQKLRIDFSNIVKQSDFAEYKKGISGKFTTLENAVSTIKSIKDENNRAARLIETTLSMAKDNKSDIDELALAVGDENISSVSDFETRFTSILEMLDSLAGEIREIREDIGEHEPKSSRSAQTAKSAKLAQSPKSAQKRTKKISNKKGTKKKKSKKTTK